MISIKVIYGIFLLFLLAWIGLSGLVQINEHEKTFLETLKNVLFLIVCIGSFVLLFDSGLYFVSGNGG